jgi:hypothetical protein
MARYLEIKKLRNFPPIKKRKGYSRKTTIEQSNKRLPATLFLEYACLDDLALKALCKLLYIPTIDKSESIRLLIDELTFLSGIYKRLEEGEETNKESLKEKNRDGKGERSQRG